LNNKLNFKKLKLFKILKKIKEVNYKLDLPNNIKLKITIFYILLLEKALINKKTGKLIINKIIIKDIKKKYKIKKLLYI
ncbi:hypothetical protein M441DRAFT_155174, partial [Trichoderma asperellum CBS 433.97]